MEIGKCLPDNITVLIVDDNPDNLTLTNFVLRNKYKVKLANSGVGALKIAQSDSPPDIILLDVMMPDMDGYEVCRQLKKNKKTKDIPIIFLTANAGKLDEMYGFKIGAIDYITKPISPPVLLARVEAHLANKFVKFFLSQKNDDLLANFNEKLAAVSMNKNAITQILNLLVERMSRRKDGYVERMRKYVFLLSQGLRTHHRFSYFLNDEVIELLCTIAPFHELGKVGVSDSILLKPDKLSTEELILFQQYPKIGYDLILKVEQKCNSSALFLFFKVAKEIAYSQNERWDGTGYPEKLSEDNIPMSARIISVANAYETMHEINPMGQCLSHEQIVKYIKGERGGKFDPEVVNVFLDLQSEFRKISC